jgi:hypothetical protein
MEDGPVDLAGHLPHHYLAGFFVVPLYGGAQLAAAAVHPVAYVDSGAVDDVRGPALVAKMAEKLAATVTGQSHYKKQLASMEASCFLSIAL